MVYVPWTVAEDYMLNKWGEALKENPNAPRPTKIDINIQWFQWLDHHPNSALELEKFTLMLPARDRHKVQFRMVNEFRQQPVKKRRQEPTPIAEPLGDEPK